MTEAIDKVLSNYAGEPAGVIGNLRRLMLTGRLAGTGKLVILPVDQGFEHGPARTYQPNPPSYDPHFHPKLAIEAGCSGYAAPLGFIQTIAHQYAGKLPLILKVNNSDSLGGPNDPHSSMTSAVEDAVRLGCSGIGFTIYPGSNFRNTMYEQLRDVSREARKYGLPTILWAYARGGDMSKPGETGIDVIAYAAQIACQLGAHIVKVKPPSAHIELEAARKHYETIPTDTLEDRIRHVVESAFNGRRLVIFSGGAAKGREDVINEIREIAKGGGHGSIVGRNAFQRPHAEAVSILQEIMDIHAAGG